VLEDEECDYVAFGGHALGQPHDLFFRSTDAEGGEDVKDSHRPQTRIGVASFTADVEIIPCPVESRA
jgi:hypothetical protein